MKKIILLFLLFLFTLTACTVEFDYSNSSIDILNSEYIYLDTLKESKISLDIEIKSAEDTSVIYRLEDPYSFVTINETGEILFSNNTPDNHTFEVMVILNKYHQTYTSKIFTCLLTRCIILGNKVISQVIATIYGDTSTTRGISWFSSLDIDDSIIYISRNSDLSEPQRLTGIHNDFSKFSEVTSKEKSTFRNHKIILSNLNPNTIYYYKVGSDLLNTYSDTHSFKTTGNDALKLFLTTDVHVGANESPNSKYYHHALLDYNNRYGTPDLAINTGDFVTNWKVGSQYYYFESEWAKAMNISSLLNETTFVPVSGNHDSKYQRIEHEYSFPNHYAIPGSPSIINDGHKDGLNYSFDALNTHIIVFNHVEEGIITNSQISWLEEDLSATNKQFKIVLTHIELPSHITSILEANNVQMVFSGHRHIYRLSSPFPAISNNTYNKTIYITNTTTGGADEMRTYIKEVYDIDGFGGGSILENIGTVTTKSGMYTAITITDEQITIEAYVRTSTLAEDAYMLYSTITLITD